MAIEMDDFVGFAEREGHSTLGVFRREPVGGAHVAFACEDHAKVDAFYEAAMAAGGKDNGAPGLRPHYHEHYYGAGFTTPTATTSRPSARSRSRRVIDHVGFDVSDYEASKRFYRERLRRSGTSSLDGIRGRGGGLRASRESRTSGSRRAVSHRPESTSRS